MQRSCGENVSSTNAERRLLCLEKSERGGGQRRNTASDPIRACGPREDVSIGDEEHRLAPEGSKKGTGGDEDGDADSSDADDDDNSHVT